MSMKSLIGRKVSKKVQFMGEEVEIKKLTVAEIVELQKASEAAKSEDEFEGLAALRKIIRIGVSDATELSDEDFSQFPLDDLSKLAEDVMEYSGVSNKGK